MTQEIIEAGQIVFVVRLYKLASFESRRTWHEGRQLRSCWVTGPAEAD